MQVEKAFDEIASEWNERHADARAWIPLFLKNFKKTDVVLDAGCGNANNAIAIALLVKKICAIDVSRQMLKFARKNVKAAGLNKKISIKRASALSLPFRDSFFDVAAYFAVVHHFQRAADRKKVFSEMSRVLKRGGFALVTVWNKLAKAENLCSSNRNMFVN
ncbi:MAG: class I SAM-dependent methyltransferase, partial [Candidatus Micrarchaeota archaeon]